MLPIHKSQRDPLSGYKQMPDATYEDNRLPKKALDEQLLRENATKNDIQKLLDGWQKPNAEGKLQPYAGVAIFFLKRRLSHAS